MSFRSVAVYWYKALSYSFAIVCLLFLQLEPSSVWLKQEYGRKCFFPDSNGSFNLDKHLHDIEGTSRSFFALLVEGTPSSTDPAPPCVASQTTHSPTTPFFKSTKNNEGGHTFNVKIVKAQVTTLPNGKPDFKRLEQMHVHIDEASANVHTITNAIKSKWGAEFVVVTADGLPVDDSAGTHGIYEIVW